jgi:hypothetical protein
MLGKSTRNLPKACCQTNNDTSSLDAATQNGSEKNTDLHGIYQRITFPNVFCKNYLRRVELLCRRKKFKWDPGALLERTRTPKIQALQISLQVKAQPTFRRLCRRLLPCRARAGLPALLCRVTGPGTDAESCRAQYRAGEAD